MADQTFIEQVEEDVAEAKDLPAEEKADILRIAKEIDAMEEAAPAETGQEEE